MDGKYYARNSVEKEFDKGIRSIVLDHGSDVEKALFTQNQVILSMLRQMEDNLNKLTQSEEGTKEEA